jgi:hypothetical protein
MSTLAMTKNATRVAVVLFVLLAMLATTATALADDSRDDEAEPAEAADAGVELHVRVRGPAIAEVLAAAYGAAGLDRDPTRGWIRRARLAGLVPWLTVRTGRNTSWQDNDPDVDHGLALELRATWRLDRLVYDGRELQVASIESARRRERRRLASRVIRTYFTWRRAVSKPGAGTRADEAAAELDALTDGWFSETLRVPRRAASETRTR